MAKSPSDPNAGASDGAAASPGKLASAASAAEVRAGSAQFFRVSPSEGPAGSTPAGSSQADSVDPGSPKDAGADSFRLAVFEDGACREWQADQALEELERAVGREAARIWVDLTSPSVDRVTAVAKLLKLHPLLAEDLVERDQRAKLEQVGDATHIVLFSLGYDDGTIYEREIECVLGKNVLLTSHSSWWDPRATRHQRGGVANILGRGTDYLLWTLADDVIDDYFPILDRLGDEIDALEDQVVYRADRALLERLFELKRELISVRRVTSPEREIFNVLSSREGGAVTAEQRLYFRDSYDHLIRLTDELDTYRELASAALETYLSTVNNNLSLIMKRLTGVTVVVAGIGAIGGIFGMSEAQYALRLDEGVGFWIVAVGSLVLAGLAAVILHKIDWI